MPWKSAILVCACTTALLLVGCTPSVPEPFVPPNSTNWKPGPRPNTTREKSMRPNTTLPKPRIIAAKAPQDAAIVASVNGKYARLLRVIEVPADRNQYGEFNDHGHWQGNAWAGYTNLPPGYWVYVYPDWYIWGDQQDPPGSVKPEDLKLPSRESARGKYRELLKVVDAPQDEELFGSYRDKGYYEGGDWAGHQDLPAGYWVYVAPEWYIWKEKAN